MKILKQAASALVTAALYTATATMLLVLVVMLWYVADMNKNPQQPPAKTGHTQGAKP